MRENLCSMAQQLRMSMVNPLLKRRQLGNYSGNWVFLTNGDEIIMNEQYLGAWHFIVVSQSFELQNPMARNEIW